ncbi:MAG: hypothetical protein GW808_05180 [Sphingomonadales bacterium]|nr:hypothetical protein [Sphingomonadales bacterium]NCO49947.1 hypothetical protein [Sphingomonadales bacterium]NCP00405.1 hypothetical protein [Sphingomonadales bacterium]NCP26785.1 hypothetical protein [Sphingomonadales bacterium]NCP43427.1 hypothetical protein [Sphingomonadales bacterium]
MKVYPYILPPLLAAVLALGLPDAAFAALSDAPSSDYAPQANAPSDGESETCAARRFGPSHHASKRSRASQCTDKQAATLMSAQHNCRLSSRGPRHVALAAKRSECANDNAPVYSDAARTNESGQ